MLAYDKLGKNKGAMTPGSLQDTIDDFSLDKLRTLSKIIKYGQYNWITTRRIQIPKPGKSTLRPLNLTDFSNKMVQEAIRLVLNSIYEPQFEKINLNFGFRPKKSTHMAVSALTDNLQGKTYAIEGDIKGAYDNVDHDILYKLLQKDIKDNKLLRLIYTGLKTRIFDIKMQETLDNFLGIPQGSVVSPLLFNRYLHELDLYVQDVLAPSLHSRQLTPKRGKSNTDYTTLRDKINAIQKGINRIKRDLTVEGWLSFGNAKRVRYADIDPNISNKIRQFYSSKEGKKSGSVYPITPDELSILSKLHLQLLTDQKQAIVSQRLNTNLKTQEYSSKSRNITYVRYADDFVILTSGPLKEAEGIKQKVGDFLQSRLRLTLSQEKTKITNIRKNLFHFLGFEIGLSRNVKKD